MEITNTLSVCNHLFPVKLYYSVCTDLSSKEQIPCMIHILGELMLENNSDMKNQQKDFSKQTKKLNTIILILASEGF